MPIITIEMSNFQLEMLQVSAGMSSQMSTLSGEAVTARFFESLTAQLKDVERDPEIGGIPMLGEVVWPASPVVTQEH